MDCSVVRRLCVRHVYATARCDLSFNQAGLPRAGIMRGLFQYGLLHFGQFFGSGVPCCLGAQRCQHRSHRKPSILM